MIGKSEHKFDALVIGAGFGGIYALYALLKLGLSVQVIERGQGPGGTWYWNRYPGAMSDSPSTFYRYSFDKEDLQQYAWKDNYLDRADVLAYLEHVVDRQDLRKHILFNTEVKSATYDEEIGTWTIETSGGVFKVRYLITAIGLLSKPNWPNIPKLNHFKGELYHTAQWPETYDLKGKRVGVIGNGSSGVQIIPAIAKDVGSLLCFQRHAQYTVPAGRRPVTKEERVKINATYDELWDQVRNSIGAGGFVESKIKAMDVSDEERERIYEAAWEKGGGIPFFLTTFADLVSDETANRTACEFVKRKIAKTVKDPEKRRKLTPTELYVRRPLCDSGYYETFNHDNVDVVDIKTNPIVECTSEGLKLSDGTTHELDTLICATGFDALDGAYKEIDITGRNGISLKEHWEKGATSNMGVAVANFPNLFMIMGPKSPLGNVPPMVETHVDFILKAIARAEEHRKAEPDRKQARIVIESTQEGEDEWAGLCHAISEATLFKTSETSYFYGSNVEGKVRSVLIFFGGVAMFRGKLQECVDSGYKSFRPF